MQIKGSDSWSKNTESIHVSKWLDGDKINGKIIFEGMDNEEILRQIDGFRLYNSCFNLADLKDFTNIHAFLIVDCKTHIANLFRRNFQSIIFVHTQGLTDLYPLSSLVNLRIVYLKGDFKRLTFLKTLTKLKEAVLISDSILLEECKYFSFCQQLIDLDIQDKNFKYDEFQYIFQFIYLKNCKLKNDSKQIYFKDDIQSFVQNVYAAENRLQKQNDLMHFFGSFQQM